MTPFTQLYLATMQREQELFACGLLLHHPEGPYGLRDHLAAFRIAEQVIQARKVAEDEIMTIAKRHRMRVINLPAVTVVAVVG